MKRTAQSVPWFRPAEAFLDHVQTAYIDTGKLVSRTTQGSTDKLSVTTFSTFATREDYLEYNQDPVVKEHQAERTLYCKINDIALTVLTQNLDVDGNPLTTKIKLPTAE